MPSFLRSIRVTLLLLVLGAMLPSGFILLRLGLEEQRREVAQAQATALSQVLHLAEQEEHFARASHQLLSVLAALPAIQQQDPIASSRMFEGLLARNPQYANILSTDAQGVLTSSGVGVSGTVSLSDRKHYRDAMATKAFSTGEFIISRTTNRRVFPFSLPILDPMGSPSGVLVAVQDLGTFEKIFPAMQLATGSDLVVLDHEGVVVHHLESPGAEIGKPIPEGERAPLYGTEDRGTFRALDRRGVPRLYAYRSLRLEGARSPYMVFRIGIPERIALADGRQALWRHLWVMGLVLLGTVALAWILGGCLIQRPVQRLLETTSSLARGHWSAATALPRDESELGRLGAALGELGCALESRETALRAQEQEGRRLEQQVLQAQKLESLGILAGGIAHDFNNLLTALLGNLSLARECPEASGPIQAFLDRAERVAHRAADLTKQMLVYAGRGRADARPISLNRVVQEMSHLLSASVPKKASLKLHLAKDLPLINGDGAQIQQVVMNLVTNAFEAIGEGEGEIRLSTACVELHEETIVNALPGQPIEPGRYVRLEVGDTGCGISPEHQDRIFDPFFSTKSSGRGLGLSAMLGIIRTHRGAIQVQSHPGQGTTFSIFFPASEMPEDTDPGILGVSGPMVGRILLVEDETAIREVTRIHLEKHGLVVTEAEDGLAALEAFRPDPGAFDLVLMDLTMPRMDGREAFRAMRVLRRDIPIVLCSGYDKSSCTRELLEEGLCTFVPKPYGMKELIATLRSYLAS